MSIPHILVVEDKAIIAKDVQATLQKAGYLVPAIASSGEKAIRKAAELQPNLILMDIRLKGQMDGIEAAQKIREKYDIPIIFLTAHADEETLKRAVLTEPFGYILKPFEARVLEVAVQVALYKHSVERKLRNQERWLAATLESIGDAVLTTDPQGKIIYLNPVAELLSGWVQEKASGQSIANVLTILDQASKIPVPNPLLESLKTGSAATTHFPSLLLLQDGREIPIDEIATPIRDGEDNIIGGVMVMHDVRESRQLEEQIRQSERLKTIGQLTGGMAHNFNNMLTVISLYTAMVGHTLPADHVGQAKLQVVQETTQRAADMVQHLLAFARNQVIRPELLQLNEQILKIIEVLHQVLPSTIELETLTQAAETWIKIDPVQLEQVVMNVIFNARDVLHEGGKITIQTSNVLLERPLVALPSGVPIGEYGLLTVTDNGPGMSREVISRIFEPFFTTKGVGEGTGLGLSTCLGIVEQNYGRITLESHLGQGTTFYIYLPQHKPPSDLTNEAKVESVWEGEESILVVEDDGQIRQAIMLSLRDYGYTLFEASNGTEALKMIETELDRPIHLLITDMVMPQMGGKTLANLLRPILPNLKVLFISGYPNIGTVPPETAFLAKPFTPQTLAQKVRRLLGAKMDEMPEEM